MSLPLTRRIARAALLIAAGAAPVVGAVGSASAATADLPATPNLGGLTALDSTPVGTTADGATQKVDGLAGGADGKVVKSGSEAARKAVPAAGETVGKAGKQATPLAQKAAGNLTGQAGGLLGDTSQTATGGGLPLQGSPLSS